VRFLQRSSGASLLGYYGLRELSVDSFEYEVKAKITEYYHKHGVLIYLEDKSGKQIARVVPCEGCDLSSLREENDIEERS